MFHKRTTEEVYREYLAKGGKPISKWHFCRMMRKAYPEFGIVPWRVNGKVVRVFVRKGQENAISVDDIKAVFG